ncbi:hypothetical protein J6590_035397 [Homalodisca vitripennis]|nr:hypothetical protein J6590_035397 [Homalodisca vitripennis]
MCADIRHVPPGHRVLTPTSLPNKGRPAGPVMQFRIKYCYSQFRIAITHSSIYPHIAPLPPSLSAPASFCLALTDHDHLYSISTGNLLSGPSSYSL